MSSQLGLQVFSSRHSTDSSNKLQAVRLPDLNPILSYRIILGSLGFAMKPFSPPSQAKALELCFRLGRYDALEQIAADLDTNSDPGILMRCAEFLVGNGQAGRALRYLAMAGEAERVLDMVEMQVEGAILDEDIVELLTPEKGKHDAAYRCALQAPCPACCWSMVPLTSRRGTTLQQRRQEILP